MNTIKNVGCWGTRSALANPEETVAGLVAARINFFSLMLNDYRLSSTPSTFRMHDVDKIHALYVACANAGIEFSMTSWIMPDRRFIEGAAAQLMPVLEAGVGSLLIWDAEEVWVRGGGDMTHDAAAALVGELFAGVDMGVTGIVHANTRALKPLTEVCETWMPQCYATTRNSPPMDPRTIVELGITKWSEKFGTPRRWFPGLPAYRQPTVPADFMQPAIDQVRANNDDVSPDSVCYWWHRAIAKRSSVREFIAGVRDVVVEQPEAPPAWGIHPTLDVAAMPSSQYSRAVQVMQWNLAGWSESYGVSAAHPGAVDGKPGKDTLAAVLAFQRAKDLEQTGVFGGAEWWAILAAPG